MSQHLIDALAMIIVSGISGFSAVKASKAEKNSRPVSNGFANDVRTELRDIRMMMFHHIQDHNKTNTPS